MCSDRCMLINDCLCLMFIVRCCCCGVQVVEEFELPQLTKLQTNIPKAEDIQWCGFLDQYDEQFDRITTRTEKRLQV